MSIASVEIGLDLDEDASPDFLDGKLRIIAEDDMVTFFCLKAASGNDYIRAECSKDEFVKALALLGIVDAD